MTAEMAIRRVLAAGVLEPDLVALPPPATPDDIEFVESQLSRPLSGQHRRLLQCWNGFDLEVIRLLRVSKPLSPADELPSLLSYRLTGSCLASGALAFATDPSGFIYLEDDRGRVYSLDHEGGALCLLAPTLDAFFAVNVFGLGAESFAGEQWRADLLAAGVLC